jgi:hypothetical protein
LSLGDILQPPFLIILSFLPGPSADDAGEFVGSMKRFSQTLEAKGYQPVRKMTGRGFQGIAVNGPD